MIENKRYSFGSPDEAIQFFAQQSEDRFKALQDKVLVIESALKAIFAMTPEAASLALRMADGFEEPPHPEGLEDRLRAIAEDLRRLAQADTEDAQEGIKLSVIEGGRSEDP